MKYNAEKSLQKENKDQKVEEINYAEILNE